MIMTKNFNIVYENWKGDEPISNWVDIFPKRNLKDPYYLIQHYINDTEFENKFNLRRCNFDDVMNAPNENFYYFVNYGVGDLCELFENKEFGKPVQLLNPISDKLKSFIKDNQNFNMVFLTEHEPDNEEGFRILNDYINNNDLNAKQFFVINNNSKIKDYNQKYNSEINTYTLNFIPHSSTKVLVRIGGCEFTTERKGKFFMCFNKSPKSHRYALLCLLKKNNILENTNWSLVPSWNCNFDESYLRSTFSKNELKMIKTEIDYFGKIDIKRSDFEDDKGWFNRFSNINRDSLPIWQQIPEHLETFLSSYVNIVTESMFKDVNNNIHISEKSFRPFYYYQIPVILSTHGHIKTLKEKYGFDFYDDIVNHSYDDEPDQKTRLIKLVAEVARLNNNKEKIVEFFKNNKERFESNKQKVIEVLNVVNQDYLYFESLI
jgi:hypothetical protein